MSAEPTELDHRNAETRRIISERQNATYAEAERLALATLGPGYTPWMKLSLLDSDYHRTGNHEPVATVYKVYRGEKRLTENSIYLRRMPDASVKRADNYEELFGDLLDEKHPTNTLEFAGKTVPAPRWTLCWSALERYEPRSAIELAKLRASREKSKAAREEKKWAEDNPLLAYGERVQGEEGMER